MNKQFQNQNFNFLKCMIFCVLFFYKIFILLINYYEVLKMHVLKVIEYAYKIKVLCLTQPN